MLSIYIYTGFSGLKSPFLVSQLGPWASSQATHRHPSHQAAPCTPGVMVSSSHGLPPVPQRPKISCPCRRGVTLSESDGDHAHTWHNLRCVASVAPAPMTHTHFCSSTVLDGGHVEQLPNFSLSCSNLGLLVVQTNCSAEFLHEEKLVNISIYRTKFNFVF